MNVRQFDGDGFLVWRKTRNVNAAKVKEAFARIGKESLAPKAQTEYEALRDAVSIIKAKDQKIERHRAHEKNGCEILQIERDTEQNAYARRLGARVHENEWGRKTVKLDCEISEHDQGRLDECFAQGVLEVSSTALTKAIVEVIQGMDGERETDGLWFIPPSYGDDLMDFVEAIEQLGVPIVPAQTRINQRLAEHVGKELTERMQKEAERLQEEIAGLKTPEAIEARKLDIAELQGRVQRYKDLLGTNLAKAEEVLTMAQTVAMIASMSAMPGVVC
jgi:hypothetical protein